MAIKGLTMIESRMEAIDPSSFRYQILDSAKRFKTNWIELAKLLYTVKKDKLYKEWGYISFDNYCSKELGIRKQTAFKLLSSYYFLTKEEPDFLNEETLKNKSPKELPNYESIDILRRAKDKDLKETDYSQLRELVLQRALEPKEVGRQYRSMLWAVKSVDPEEERRKKRLTTIKRLISTLKNLKKEVELLNLLPDKPIQEIDKLIKILEAEI